MPKEKIVPIRTCIACRQEFEKKELLRIVKNAAGEIQLDFSGKLNGRGAYICKNAACFERLKKQKLLHKTFSMQVSDAVYEKIGEEFLEKK